VAGDFVPQSGPAVSTDLVDAPFGLDGPAGRLLALSVPAHFLIDDAGQNGYSTDEGDGTYDHEDRLKSRHYCTIRTISEAIAPAAVSAMAFSLGSASGVWAMSRPSSSLNSATD
jgi:hypothetical protein